MRRTLVAIPLHRSLAWVDNVERNARTLAPVARVLISDADESDGALEVLRHRLSGVEGVEMIGARKGATGWVEHCNDLQRRASTEFFMWLPHDDEVDADWVVEAEAALDAQAGAALACGPISEHGDSALHGPDGPKVALEIPAWAPVADDTQRRLGMVRAMVDGDVAAFGIMFRGVQRTVATLPLPSLPGGVHADAVWSAQMMARSRVLPLTATYRKRWHERSVHAPWGALIEAEEPFRAAVRACIEGPDAAVVGDTMVAALREHLLASQGAAKAASTLARDLQLTVSWRATAGLRKVRTWSMRARADNR